MTKSGVVTPTFSRSERFLLWLEHAKASLLFSVFGYASVCRHRPSCSRYALKVIRERGTISGLFLAIGRILSCW